MRGLRFRKSIYGALTSPVATTYVNQYDPSQLFPISRETGRQTLGLSSADLPFEGFDLWNAYEFTYLTQDGVPRHLALRLWIPIQSPSLIESKSMKLYLGSFAGSRFESESEVIETIARDLSEALGLGRASIETEPGQMPPELVVRVLSDADLAVPSRPEGWICLDREIPEQILFDYSPSLLRVASNRAASEVLYSDGFRSLCSHRPTRFYVRIVLATRASKSTERPFSRTCCPTVSMAILQNKLLNGCCRLLRFHQCFVGSG